MCVSTVLSVAATVGERLLYIELENEGMTSVQSWENGKRDHLGLDRTETEEKVETNQRILPSDWCCGSNQHLDWSLGSGPRPVTGVRQCAALPLWKCHVADKRGLASC